MKLMKKLIVISSLLFLFGCTETETTDNLNDTQTIETIDPVNSIEKIDEVIEDNTLFDSIAEFTETQEDLVIETSSDSKNSTTITTNVTSVTEAVKTVNEDVIIEEVIETAIPKPNHSVWDELLRKNVTSSGKVNYTNMKSSLVKIETYIKQLEGFTSQKEWSRNEKLAYWINLYNAATVRLIIQNYPTTSITKINGGKPWDKKVVKIGSKSYSLNQIENDIIRPKFKEPRIHFAVNCAAKSCPKLMNSAFMPDKLSSQLSKQARGFINGSKNDIASNKIAISKIFEWYADDFGSSVVDYLNKYSSVKIDAGTPINYKEYNWDLNK